MSMGTELYFQVEVASPKPARWRRWWHFARIRLSEDYLLFALLAGVRREGFRGRELECLSPKGLPEDVTELSLAEDALSVDDEAAGLEVPDTCTRANAEEWVRSGVSRFLHNGHAVTHPDFHGQSWLSHEELELVRHRYAAAGGRDLDLLQAALAMLESLRTAGHVSRVVFWFSG
jgi:hypothetical protein